MHQSRSNSTTRRRAECDRREAKQREAAAAGLRGTTEKQAEPTSLDTERAGRRATCSQAHTSRNHKRTHSYIRSTCITSTSGTARQQLKTNQQRPDAAVKARDVAKRNNSCFATTTSFRPSSNRGGGDFVVPRQIQDLHQGIAIWLLREQQ